MQGRNFGLDLLRSVLMLIGVPYHVALMMDADLGWLNGLYLGIDNIIYQLTHFTHLFRMQAFFLVAGFFSILVIDRKNKKNFIENRKKRVLVPLIFSMVTISPWLLYVKAKNEGLEIVYSDLDFFSFVQHLWFLITLMILSVLTYVGAFKKLIEIVRHINKIKLLVYIIFIRFLVFAVYGLAVKLNLDDYFLLTKTYQVFVLSTIDYGFYYVIGCSFYKDKERVNSIQFPLYYTLITTILYTVFFVFIEKEFVSGFSLDALKIAYYATAVIPGYFASTFLFKFFKDLDIKYSKFINFLVDSSIIIYLFHLPVLYYVARGLNPMFDNVYAYFFAICFFTYIITTIIYYLVKSNRYTSYMYGLKFLKSKGD